MGNYQRLLSEGSELTDKLAELARTREQLPSGMGATPEIQAAEAYYLGDDEAARFAFNIADKIEKLRSEIDSDPEKPL